MTSKEIVRRTLEYTSPERVARSFDESDFLHVNHSCKTYATEWEKAEGVKWQRYDEWGNLWERIDDTSKGEVIKGVFENIDASETYKFPDFSKGEEYEEAKHMARANQDKWILASIPGFTFNIARKLFKLEDYLVFLMTEREIISAIHDKIDNAILGMIENYAIAGADSIFFPEDWGTQNQTLVNPVVWEKEFYPRTKMLYSFAHQLGLKVFMHSCGAIGEIVPGLMQAGIDLLQFDQPTLHGIDKLAEYQELGNISFWCPVDIQKTLQTKDEAQIKSEASELLDKLWHGRGGFVAGNYPENASIGLEPKWQEIASKEFVQLGVAERYE